VPCRAGAEGFDVNAEKSNFRRHAMADTRSETMRTAIPAKRRLKAEISSLDGEAYSPFYW
jgi:hypothetical protein